MSHHYDDSEIPKHVEAGRLLSERLRIARETSGPVECPGCHMHFDATHVIKCPKCRTVIDTSFQAVSAVKKEHAHVRSRRRRKKPSLHKARLAPQIKETLQLELDFFRQSHMEYKG